MVALARHGRLQYLAASACEGRIVKGAEHLAHNFVTMDVFYAGLPTDTSSYAAAAAKGKKLGG